MTLGASEIFALVGLLLAGLGALAGAIRYLNGRIDQLRADKARRIDELRQETAAKIERVAERIDEEIDALRGEISRRSHDIHNRLQAGLGEMQLKVDAIRAEYVRRDELNAHLTRLELQVTNLNTGLTGLNRRIDQVLAMLAGRNHAPQAE